MELISSPAPHSHTHPVSSSSFHPKSFTNFQTPRKKEPYLFIPTPSVFRLIFPLTPSEKNKASTTSSENFPFSANVTNYCDFMQYTERRKNEKTTFSREVGLLKVVSET